MYVGFFVDFLWVVLVAPTITDAAPYWLGGPPEYTVFSGDVYVNYIISETHQNFRVKLIEIDGGNEIAIVKKDVPKNTTVGQVVFPCGIVDKAGHIVFVLVTANEELVLARSDEIIVYWPKVVVHVPLLVETYTSDVEVRLELMSGKCSPRQKGNYDIFIHLVYLGPSTPSAEEGLSWYHSTVTLSRKVYQWFFVKNVDIAIECWNFDRPGVYQVSLHAPTIETSPHIATSENFRVVWSRRYSINIPQPAIFPCVDGTTVVYHYPRCTGDSDRLRIYGRPLSAARHLSTRLDYVSEMKLPRGKHSLQIPCNVFSEEFYEFCLSYVSVAKTGAVFEVRSQCRHRIIDPGGGPTWGDWSTWSPCSTTCGASVRSRYRLCNKENGQQCSGLPTKTESCDVPECPDVTETTTAENYLSPPGCQCGCTINIVQNGTLEMISGVCALPVIWFLSAWPQGEIQITFREVNLVAEKQWLSVRDGQSPVSPLLGIVNANSESGNFVSRTSTLRVELHDSNHTLEGGVVIFKVSYFRIGSSDASVIGGPLSEKVTSVFGAVHITAVIVLCLVAVAICTLVILYRTYWMQNMKSQQSFASDSTCSSLPEHRRDKCSHVRLLHPSTSLSEISGSPLSLKRRTLMMELDETSDDECRSPEDFLIDNFIFRSISLESSKCMSPPKPSAIVTSPRTQLSKRLPIAAVSPQPHSRRPVRDVQSPKDMTRDEDVNPSQRTSPIRWREKTRDKGLRSLAHRDSAAQLTASLSEFSLNTTITSEDGFEYDYYDYTCHDLPGSFFCQDPLLIEWPPFIPIPPDFLESLPLRLFSPTPTTGTQTDGECHECSEESTPVNSEPVKES